MVDSSLVNIAFITGFFVVALASRQIGAYVNRLKLPLITGFLFTGMLAGPYVLGIISPEAVQRLRFVDEFSLAYIAFAAGSELVMRQIKGRMRAIRFTTIGLVSVTFSIGSLAFYLLSGIVPFTREMPPAHRAAVALLAGAILVARSPSSAIAVVNELRAKGPFTKTILGVTVIMDGVVITLFSICTAIAGTLLAGKHFDPGFVLIIGVELGVSLGMGYLLSRILNFLLARHWARSAKTLLIILAGYGVFWFSIALAQFTHLRWGIEILLEPMLICMLAGFLTANVSPYRTELMKTLNDVAPAVYVAFFTLAGASLQIDVLAHSWAIALALFGVRLAAVSIGTFTGGVLAGEPMKHNRIAWMGYVTQAGVGLGLAKQTAVAFPDWGNMFATIIIAVIVLNQVAGPPLFKWALHLAGEAHPRATGQPPDRIRDAVIFGLEGASLSLARLLQSNGWEVKIATTQVSYAHRMAPTSDIEIHAIPALNFNTLNKLGIGHADSIVAMLSDEENYRICELVYENFGTRNFIVRLNERTYVKRFHELGALVVDPATAMVNLLDQFVRSPSAARLLLGLEPGREIIEFELTNPDLRGQAIRDLHLPLDLHILSIRRDGHPIVSMGFTRLQLGDWLTVVGSRTSLEQMMLDFGEDREHALVHMVGRATSREMVSKTLEAEVETLLHSSADGNHGRFQRLIDDCIVLDLPEAMTYERFFQQAAGALSDSVGLEPETLFQLLMAREKESGTALRPDLAIPHIIIGGHDRFHLLLARCREGLYFSELAPRVRAVFVLAGTRDQRDHHLYALSAIAGMVQRPHFREAWLGARNEAVLRNIVKTGKEL